jgi:hypothetical protein
MSILDLVKATVICGGSAFLIYNWAIVSQILIIAVLTVLWLGYAHRAISHLRRR